jgi:alpha-tubulin suppressor-like RCC1 family protein
VTAVGLSGVVAASSGVTHSLALINDGTVRSWGGNNVGQLGTGTTTGRLSTGTVPGLTGVVAIAAGRLHSLAARSDGTVWTWGNNAQGTLGNGTTVANSLSPVQALNLTGVTDVAAGVGGNSVAALRNDGTVWTWGDNASGQLGDGTLTQRNAPVKVLNLTGVTAIATANAHMVALRNDGTVWTWGYNASGQLGNGTTSAYSTTPVRVAGLTGVVRIAAGAHHTLALRNDGTVWGWGSNSYGQTDCSFVASPTPVKVSSLTGVVEISAGTFHSLARKSDGTIWAWGHNSYGQLGDSGSFRCEPTRWND